MDFEALKKFIEENKTNADVQNYLKGLFSITPEGVKAFLETADGKKLIQPMLDAHFSKSLETWKEKTMPGVLEEEILKRFPNESPEQKKLRALEDELNKEKSARVRSELMAKATTTATQKGLPVEVVKYLLGDDETLTMANIDEFFGVWQASTTKLVEDKFKESGRSPVPPKAPEKNKINPWKKETFNLTEQGRITKENPELARQLQAEAKN